MTPFRNRLKTPEEIELDRKYGQLSEVKGELAVTERIYDALKNEIRLFEQVYEDILGVRIQTLEDLEWQLKGLLGEATVDESGSETIKQSTFTPLHNSTDLLDDDESTLDAGSSVSLKSLYRGVAKAVHPDLAADDADRLRRQELMAIANEAYRTGNRQVLSDLLSEWEQTPEPPGTELEIALELVRVIRQIAAVQQNIHAVLRQTDELKQTDIYIFKIRVNDALADGVDLLAEMADVIDLDISRIQRRLSALRGDSDDASGADAPLHETRVIRFPVDQNCGNLFIRKASSVDFRDWQRIGIARGIKEVFLDTAVRLDIKISEVATMKFITDLQPGDLQSLFLYNCDDIILSRIAHLTGLQELYLSDSTVTDQGLKLLLPLSSLQRISIYHTAIGDDGLFNLAQLPELKWLTCSETQATDEGLNQFRLFVPACKTVNFKWRY